MGTDKNTKIENVEFDKALSERYLSYALSTIMSRSLPSVRDGLKPVHRRLLYAMSQLNLSPGAAYKKCARIVGDVMGKYHPHGEAAIYEALVRLAQDFSVRYPLIDGQGNFGSIDGDNAASMRYTESKMTDICTLLMEDIDKNSVDFRGTYDNSEQEPVVFPAAFPNVLANGAEGIAVGMATNIPPHNLEELCGALVYLIENQNATVEDLLQFIQGPDLPTGGIIIDNKKTILRNYETGKGTFRVRAKWHKEEIKKSSWQIVVTEIPYQVSKSKLVEELAELLQEKKIPLVDNIYDESTDEIRLVIEPKSSNIEPETLMESLFRLTKLEGRVQLNLNMLDYHNIPRVMNLLEILKEFLYHRQIVVTRRSEYLYEKTLTKINVAEGLRIAYLNLDEVIYIIRNEDEPKEVLMKKFQLLDVQAEAILNMRLRSLRKLDEQELLNELKTLRKTLADIENILKNPKNLWKSIKQDIQNIQTKFSKLTALGKRKTIFIETEPLQDLDVSAFIEKEPLTIICSQMGWIRTLKGHNNDLSNIKYKEGDKQQFVLPVYSTDKLILMASNGKIFNLIVANIYKGKGDGDSLKLLIDIGSNDIVNIFVYHPEQKILLVSSLGKGFIINSDDLLASTKSGKQVMNLPNGAYCNKCVVVDKNFVALIGDNRKLLIIKVDEIPEMKRGQGITLQRFKGGKLADLKLFNKEEGLTYQVGNKIKIEKDITPWLGHCGGKGNIPPHGFSRDNKFYNANSL